MATNYSLEIHLLVHSLSASEKAYFKRGLTKRNDSRLAQVFDIINKTPEHNKELLSKKIQPIYSSITDAYRQLEASILRSVSRYRSDSTAQAELNTLLIQIEFAHSRNLLKMGGRLIKKGLNIAQKNNFFNYSVLLLEQRLKLVSIQNDPGNKLAKKIHVEIAKFSEYQQIVNNQSFLNLKIVDFNKNHKLSREGLRFFFDNVIESGLATIPRKIDKDHILLTIKGFNLRNGTYFYYGDYKTALKGSFELLEILGPGELLSERLYKSWLSITKNILVMAGYLLDGKTYFETKEKIEKVRTLRRGKTEEFDNENYILYNLMHLICLGELDKALDLINKNLEHLNNQGTESHVKTSLKVTLAQVYFYQQKYQQAITEISLLMNDEPTKDKLSAKDRLRWIDLFSTYFINDVQLFQSKRLAMSRYLKQNDSGFNWEFDLMDTLRKTFGESQKTQTAQFKLLYEKVSQYENEFRATAHGFNLLHFIEAMSLGISMNQLMAKRYLGG